MKTEKQSNKKYAIVAVGKVASEIKSLIEESRARVSVTANLALVNLYWNIGRIITEDIQHNNKRAEYGTQILDGLAVMLTRDYGAGYSRVNLQDMRRFFESFEICQSADGNSRRKQICQPVADKLQNRIKGVDVHAKISIELSKDYRLGWTHYRMLLGVPAGIQRCFYFEQATKERWSKRELSRQINRGLFERVALSIDTKALVKEEKSRAPDSIKYPDIFKDPYILDFLGLKGAYSEKDLESAIIRNLEQFIEEMGTDFCFIGRQYSMRIDDDDYYLDLLFYHRGLKCLVAIDLKIGKFTAADKGQMDLYLAWLKEHEWRKDENEPVGLILCTSAKRQHVELLLRHGPHKMKVAEYLTHLPSKKLLESRLKIYSRLLKDKHE